MIFPEQNELTRALLEWRDAGGPVEDVVEKIVALIENELDVHLSVWHAVE
jgi:hypothetical protein